MILSLKELFQEFKYHNCGTHGSNKVNKSSRHGQTSKARDLRDERSESGLVSQDGQSADGGIGRPDAEPEEDIGDGHLGDLDLGALVTVFAAPRPEAVHIHLLGLGPQRRLVINDSLDQGELEEGRNWLKI